jgi:alpha-mannosidase
MILMEERMGLTMSEKRSVTRETVSRYRIVDKKHKQRILDEFTQTTGYRRKYAIHLLSTWGKEHYTANL